MILLPAWLLTGLGAVGSWLIGRAMIALGVGILIFVGVSDFQDWAFDRLIQLFQGLPSDMLVLMARAKVGVFISLVFSAMSIRLMIAMTQGTIRKITFGLVG